MKKLHIRGTLYNINLEVPFIRKIIVLLITLVLFYGCQTRQDFLSFQTEVSISQANDALGLSLTKIEHDYLWSADGPNRFDCSGLIVWAYQEVMDSKLIFTDGIYIIDDSSMDNFYKNNIRSIDNDEVSNGDIIFITNDHNIITHGGLVISIDDKKVTFINASSYHDKVVTDEWPLDDNVRGQWIVGFGRLLISH